MAKSSSGVTSLKGLLSKQQLLTSGAKAKSLILNFGFVHVIFTVLPELFKGATEQLLLLFQNIAKVWKQSHYSLSSLDFSNHLFGAY